MFGKLNYGPFPLSVEQKSSMEMQKFHRVAFDKVVRSNLALLLLIDNIHLKMYSELKNL